MGENLRRLYDLMDTIHNDIPGLLILIDFEKAFDSVSWEFIFKVLEFYNFGDSFKRYVKVNSCLKY